MKAGSSVCITLRLALIALLGLLPSAQAALVAKGIVYHDKNQNRLHDPNETGIPGVQVSNGSEVVTTKEEGDLFLICPSQNRTGHEVHLARQNENTGLQITER